MYKVSIIQRVLTDYRVPFFESLREELQKRDIVLNLIYGRGNKSDQRRGYLADIQWAQCQKERYIHFGRYSLVYQPYLASLKDSQLIIIGHEMKYLLNHLLLMNKKFSQYKIAFWGHSMNYQEGPASFMNRVKRKLNNLPDWWFSYTPEEAKIIEANGYPRERISVVENSIDLKPLIAEKNHIPQRDIEDVKRKLEIKENDKIGLFCGGIYKEKRVDFLIDACKAIKKDIPGFHMIFIGGGPMDSYIKEAAKGNPWIHFLGPVYDHYRKALHFMISDVLLLPGLVGLAILDSFALEVPMVTTQYPFHSPEIKYLEHQKNGIITVNSLDEYCSAVTALLKNQQQLNALKSGCRASIEKYSMERMVQNFANGIEYCLKGVNTQRVVTV